MTSKRVLSVLYGCTVSKDTPYKPYTDNCTEPYKPYAKRTKNRTGQETYTNCTDERERKDSHSNQVFLTRYPKRTIAPNLYMVGFNQL